MRIERLQIDGFGYFFQREVGPLDVGLTVIAGPNEAGKSTLLAFVRAILFGFPARGSDYHYPPLTGGRHGGRVAIIADDGQRYTVERHRGPRGGQATVTAADGSQRDGVALPELVGHASLDLFQSVFAFGLDELQDMGSLSGAEVSGRIYSAGIGASSLPKVLRELEAEQGGIFTVRGRKHHVANVLAEMQEVDSKLEELSAQAAEYGDLTTHLVDVERDLRTVDQRRAAFQSRIRELDRFKRGWGELAPLLELEGQLDGIPPFEGFPEDATVRLDNLEGQLRVAEQEMREAAEELERAEGVADVTISDEALLQEGDAVEHMRRRLGSFQDSVRHLPEREADLRGMQRALDDGIRDLGPGWDEARVVGSDTSMTVHDEVGQWGQRLTETDQKVRDHEGGLERRREEHQDAVDAEAGARSVVDGTPEPPLDADALEIRRGALRTARSRLNELTQLRHRRRDLEAQLGQETGPPREAGPLMRRLPLLPLVLIGVGLSALVVGLVVSGQEAALAIGVVLVVLGVVAYAMPPGGRLRVGGLVSPRDGPLRSLLEDALREEAAAEAALREESRALGLELPDAGALDGVDEELDGAADALRIRNDVMQRLADASKHAQRCERRVEEAQEVQAQALDARSQAQTEWSAWLKGHQLVETLMPVTVNQLLERIETARVKHDQVVEMRNRANAIRKDIEEYRGLVGPLAAKHGANPQSSEADAPVDVADRLIARFEAAREEATRRNNAKEAADGARRSLEKHRRRVEALREEVGGLIAAGGAADSEELRRRAALHVQRRTLEETQRGQRMRLQQLCAPGESLESLIEALRQGTPESISEEWERLEGELREIDERRDELVAEKARVNSRLEQLTGEEASSALRAERAMLVERLCDHAREWSKLTIAQSLLRRARQRYEQERQPGVMRYAERFFKTVTGGRYNRLYAPLGEHRVTVESSDGSTRRPEELSRGTREQLYLALRFGLIREFSEHAEPLPVVVDEALVNFDPERARRAVQAFVELSQTNQVLVFTCHPSTVKLFKGADPDAKVIDLDTSASGSEAQARLM